MLSNLPLYITVVFILSTLATLFFFYRATGRSKTVLLLSTAWLALQGGIGYSLFYTDTTVIPPRFILLVAPPLAFIASLFLLKKGRAFLDRIDPIWSTWLHTVRIPVEFVLYWLFLEKHVPELMTFAGRNFDIIAGITAPLIVLFGYRKQVLSKPVLLIWNVLCLGLLLNIVINAVLSAPLPIQQFAFDQPNVGVLYFPFVWLPGFVVPVVLLMHLVNIRKLLVRS